MYLTISVGQEYDQGLAGFSGFRLQQSKYQPGCVLIWRPDWKSILFQALSGCWQNLFLVAVRLRALASFWLLARGYPQLLEAILTFSK